jgi:hypothetical protein
MCEPKDDLLILQRTKYDWGYKTEPQTFVKGLNDGKVFSILHVGVHG